MITHLKAFKHKGLKEVLLQNLSHINVVCGKNSSGKSTILESLIGENTYAIGYQNTITKFQEASDGQLNSYSSPNKTQSWQSLARFFEGYCNKYSVLFSDAVETIASDITAFANDDSYLGQWKNAYNYNVIAKNFFSIDKQNYLPVLIPPKRTLESKVPINFSVALEPNGNGCINHLFFLKNQHIKSSDFQVFQNILTTFNEITGYSWHLSDWLA